MGVDGPDDFDMPRFGDSSSGDPAESRSRVAVEERDRYEYWEDLRAAVAADAWEVAADRFRWQWTSHCERWPAESRPPVDRSGDLPGSWRGDGGRYLDAAANADVERRCEGIAEVERDVVSPAMREIEACDPERQLVGFDHRLKGLDRLKDKVAETLKEQSALTVGEAVADVSDTIRFTFCYDDGRYAVGVRDDIARLKDQGFELDRLKNYWTDALYKGINAQWIVPATGQRFEVQFHTQTSFEAKQLTHRAYERLRSRPVDAREEDDLAGLQGEVSGAVPIPAGATKIPSYPERVRNVGQSYLLRDCHQPERLGQSCGRAPPELLGIRWQA